MSNISGTGRNVKMRICVFLEGPVLHRTTLKWKKNSNRISLDVNGSGGWCRRILAENRRSNDFRIIHANKTENEERKHRPLCFRGRSTDRHDRHDRMILLSHKSKWRHKAVHETGSSYNSTYYNGRKTIPITTTGFSMTPIDEWNTDRHRNMHAWCSVQRGDVETGSIHKLGCEQGRDAIPLAAPRF